ncbi:uncharacterized protein C2845_PM14G21550 [Panicum miliaceum]|uniref:KIB1-4 beta-propeller domain-containing protein n=1 Tax=Panicum miliaceum TaxID=4540 RepID=A0A3L6PNK1_PANMI|nr:uncharacterized protein C2845_PM14G21550 [Panicum miliaceum]
MALSNRRRSCSPPATASSPYFPPELIPEVARRLTSLQDFFTLRAVCRTYRALLPLTSSNLASQAPLLLVPFEDESNALFHPTLRQIHRFRLHRMHLPLTGRDWAVTEFHPLGCRLAIYEIRGKVGQPSRCSLSIVSLLTGERTCLSGLPERISRVLLYGDLVLTWKYMERAIQYCRLEAGDWRVASIIEPYKLQDLICVNGILYSLVIPGYRLAAVELSEDKNSVELVLGGNFDMHGEFPPRLHLAECCGELILIRTMDLDPRVYHFFRWKFGEAKWERITSLGGCTLFLTDGGFVGCLGPDHKGIRGDSMYITEYSDGNWYEYALIDGSFNRFVAEYPGRAVPLVICPLFWVLPSMS